MRVSSGALADFTPSRRPAADDAAPSVVEADNGAPPRMGLLTPESAAINSSDPSDPAPASSQASSASAQLPSSAEAGESGANALEDAFGDQIANDILGQMDRLSNMPEMQQILAQLFGKTAAADGSSEAAKDGDGSGAQAMPRTASQPGPTTGPQSSTVANGDGKAGGAS